MLKIALTPTHDPDQLLKSSKPLVKYLEKRLGLKVKVINVTDYAMTGGTVQPGTAWFWFALGVSLLAGFLAPLPYNYYKLRKHGHACH